MSSFFNNEEISLMQESATMINRERFMVHRKAKRISRNTVATNGSAVSYMIHHSAIKNEIAIYTMVR